MSNQIAATIRLVQDSDYVALAKFFEENNEPEITRYFHPFPLDSKTAYKLACTEHRDRYYVAIQSDKIIGLCMLRGWDQDFDIPSFGVLVDFRFQGLALGKKMAKFSIAKAEQIKCPAIRVSVYSSNKRARQLYENLGFTETSREPVSVEGQQDFKIVMMKELKT